MIPKSLLAPHQAPFSSSHLRRRQQNYVFQDEGPGFFFVSFAFFLGKKKGGRGELVSIWASLGRRWHRRMGPGESSESQLRPPSISLPSSSPLLLPLRRHLPHFVTPAGSWLDVEETIKVPPFPLSFSSPSSASTSSASGHYRSFFPSQGHHGPCARYADGRLSCTHATTHGGRCVVRKREEKQKQGWLRNGAVRKEKKRLGKMK